MQDEILTYVSGTTAVEFSHRKSTPYWWNDADGMDGLENTIYTSQGVDQDGSNFISSNLNSREITITGQLAENPAANRLKLLSLMNPKKAGRLIYESGNVKRYIPCYIRRAPIFSRGLMPSFQITFTCPSPFWREGEGAEDNYIDIVNWADALEWPNDELEFTGDYEIEYKVGAEAVNIINHGDVDAGITIAIRATASTANPVIRNRKTGEQISLTLDVQTGDEIRISTGYGEKAARLTRGGETTNIFNSVDIASDWLQLHPGDNLFEYSAADENALEISVYFDAYYLGV